LTDKQTLVTLSYQSTLQLVLLLLLHVMWTDTAKLPTFVCQSINLLISLSF